MKLRHRSHALIIGGLLVSASAGAAPFNFNTGNVDGLMATASRPGTGTFEIESGDDFVLADHTKITSASFIGLLPTGVSLADIGQIRVEIYRVFPNDSDTSRTSGPPTFSTVQVPTRVNSPADVALDTRDSAGGGLTFNAAQLSSSFTASNSLKPGGIHPLPGQNTGGDGAVTGQEVQIDVAFNTPFDLAADHYFFVPQVELASGDFLWLSSVRPIVAPGTSFSPDLQAWARDQFLDPDWLRIGTDIVGGTTFNLAFSLAGETVAAAIPEPGSLALLALGAVISLGMRRRSV